MHIWLGVVESKANESFSPGPMARSVAGGAGTFKPGGGSNQPLIF
jgi:hypothetical protein